MSEPKLLDEQLLAALEQRWRAKGASTPEIMEPGLTDEEIAQIAEPLGFTFPDELRTLYRWHDGSGLGTFIWRRGMLSLADAVTGTQDFRRNDEEWSPSWLLILDERPYVAVDCSGGRLAPAPVWHIGYDWGSPTRPTFASVGDMVSFWIELIDDDLMYWDEGRWQVRDDRISENALERLSGVPQD